MQSANCILLRLRKIFKYRYIQFTATKDENGQIDYDFYPRPLHRWFEKLHQSITEFWMGEIRSSVALTEEYLLLLKSVFVSLLLINSIVIESDNQNLD